MRSSVKRLRGAMLAGALALVLTSSASAQLTPAQRLAAARMNSPLFQVNPLLLNAARLNYARNVAVANQAAALAQRLLSPPARGACP